MRFHTKEPFEPLRPAGLLFPVDGGASMSGGFFAVPLVDQVTEIEAVLRAELEQAIDQFVILQKNASALEFANKQVMTALRRWNDRKLPVDCVSAATQEV